MKIYTNILKSNELFFEFSDENLLSILNCLGATIKKYNKNDKIFGIGDTVSSIGIVLNGTISIAKYNVDGNRNVVGNIEKSKMFGEVFACRDNKESLVEVAANSNCEVLFIDIEKILSSCTSTCSFHTKLIKNMIKVIANKNIELNQKLDIISARTIRDKVLFYFDIMMKSIKSKKFTIPFNRDELADFLNVNRSSLSRELCNMRDEGLIKFDKNRFEVIG